MSDTPFDLKPGSSKSHLRQLQGYLITGLLVWMPLGATVWVVRFVLQLLDRSVVLLPPRYQPEALLGFNIPGLGLIIIVVLLLITGFLATNFFGKRVVLLWERLLNRIPLVRTIYNGVKQVAETVLSNNSRSFKKVLLVEYPRKGLWCIGFETSSDLGEVQARTGEKVVCVFVPTTPNPTSGFIVMVPEKDATELDMTVDEAVKMVISLGVIVPKYNPS